MMNVRSLGAAVALAALTAATVPAQAEEAAAAEKPQYVGVEECGKCHKKDSTGDQLAQWQGSKHAGAFATLASDKAKAIAQKKGIADPQKAQECLRCHVTQPKPDMIETPREGKEGFVVAHGVQCETCHGAGSLYKSRKIMKDHDLSVANGLIMPDEKLCTTCHNSDSPTFDGFNFKEMVAKVSHPNPENAAPPAAK